MADESWRDRAARSGAQVAAPGGYQQTVTGNDRAAAQGQAPKDWRELATERGAMVPPGGSSGTVAWGTGGNIEDIENGWNTPFYDKMFKQRAEAEEEGTLDKLYDRSDFTGIVTTDPKGSKDERRKFGAIYEGGQYQGNLYEDAGYDKHGADWIMGRLLLDKTVFAKAQTPEQLTKELDKARKDATIWQERGAGAAAFERKSSEFSDELQNNAGAQIANVGTGIAGGALTGAAVATLIPIPIVSTLVGGVVGGVFGGVSAWLNQDEILDTVARVKVRNDQAADQGVAALTQASTLAAGLGEVGMKFLTPVGNMVHGLYDVSQGSGVGDSQAGWYATDPVTGESTRNGWVTALGYASILPDSVGTFGAKAARAAYTGLMGATVSGQVGQLVTTGGSTWDDRRGDFDNIFLDDDGTVNLLTALPASGPSVSTPFRWQPLRACSGPCGTPASSALPPRSASLWEAGATSWMMPARPSTAVAG